MAASWHSRVIARDTKRYGSAVLMDRIPCKSQNWGGFQAVRAGHRTVAIWCLILAPNGTAVFTRWTWRTDRFGMFRLSPTPTVSCPVGHAMVGGFISPRTTEPKIFTSGKSLSRADPLYK